MTEINKDTIVCISIATRPGNTGAKIFNSTFRELGLNYIYKPFGVTADELEGAVQGIRSLKIRGCGVSMPHKIKVMQYMDEIDDDAQRIGAINTIVNNNGILKGYNTDFEGARALIKDSCGKLESTDIIIAGAGGVARALIGAVRANGAKNIFVTSRDGEKSRKLAEEFNITSISWSSRNSYRNGMLINATPLGMGKDDTCPFDTTAIKNSKIVMDVVISKKGTPLIKEARNARKITLPGFKMACLQGVAQFKLYTGKSVPVKTIEKIMNEC